MTASAGAWYRVGTVSVKNNNAAIVGVGSNWQNDFIAIAIGDAFTIDAKTWYEVIAVNSDTSITLDRGFEGSTASDVEYAILRNTSGTILTRIAGQIAVQFNQKQLFLDELRNWLTSDDDTTTLTDSHGIAHVVKTVNKIQALTGTAATADLTTSPTDTTPGRALKVGDFGVGTTVGISFAGEDLDLVSAALSGYYTNTTLNTPFANTFGAFSFIPIGTGGVMVAISTSSETMFYRAKVSGSWRPWQELYSSKNTNLNDFTFSQGDVKSAYVRGGIKLLVDLPTSSFTSPTSITATGTFSIIDISNGQTVFSGLTPTIDSISSPKNLVVSFSGAFDRTLNYIISADAGGATIKANF
ncbi:hypothetical protein [Pseudoalteromonas sp. NCIMB_1079]|uniref:hypothetical protein n=1 Tax=Pseudoalteromonas sp. NCIMB 1079 TaxID=3142847 RepID=UPI00339D05FB